MTNRKTQRQPLQIDLSACLFTAADRQAVRCLGVDTSPDGIGIVGFQEFSEGTALVLVLNGAEISLEVAWCRADSVRKGVYHLGLRKKQPNCNVEEELRKAGLLKKIETFKFPGVKGR
jgi:hypothetical protein